MAIAAAPAAGSPAARYGDKRSCKPTMPCLSKACGPGLFTLSACADAKEKNEIIYVP